MKKIKVEICLGTTCYVLGSASLVDLEKRLPAELADSVEVIGSSCLDICNKKNDGEAPFVRIGERIIDNASVERIVEALYEELQQEDRR